MPRLSLERRLAPPTAGTPTPPGAIVVDGLVIDAEARPVPDALVTLTTQPLRSTRTDAQGRWAFEGVSPGRYAVAAAKEDRSAGPVSGEFVERQDPIVLRLVSLPRVLEVLVLDRTSQRPIVGAAVTARGLSEVEGETGRDGRSPPLLIDGFEPVVPITAFAHGYVREEGQVTLPPGGGQVVITLSQGLPLEVVAVERGTGRPIESALVTLSRRGADLGSLLLARTDEAGRAQVQGLGPGRWAVEVKHDDYVEFTSVLVAGETARLEVALSRGLEVRGRVVAPSGESVIGANVFATGTAVGLLATTPADAVGAFVIAGLRPGSLTLEARQEGLTSLPVELELRENEPPAPVVLTMPGPGVIAGRVLDRAGAPVRAVVTASPGTERRRAQTVPTGADGVFRFARLGDSKTWELKAARVKLVPNNPNPFTDLETPPVQVKLGDERVVLRMPAGASVRGRVVFADGSAPERFTVEAWQAEVEVSAATGRFVLNDVLPTLETQSLRISGPGFTTVVKPVHVKEGAVLDVGTVVVSRGRTLRGRVVTASGEPVAEARVTVQRTEGDFSGLTALSRADGRFEVQGVASETRWVRAEHPKAGTTAELPLPRGDDDAPVELVLRVTTSLSGRLVRQGAPLPRVAVEASLLGEATLFVTSPAGDDGRFELHGLIPGRWLLGVKTNTGRHFINRGRLVLPTVVEVGGEPRDLGDVEVPPTRTVTLSTPKPGLFVLASVEVSRDGFTSIWSAARGLAGRGGQWHVQGLGPEGSKVELLPERLWACVLVADPALPPECSEFSVADQPEQSIVLP